MRRITLIAGGVLIAWGLLGVLDALGLIRVSVCGLFWACLIIAAGVWLVWGAFANAGQVCISAQRVIALGKVHGDFLDAMKENVEGIVVGDQLDERTTMGPMIRESDALRVQRWVDDAVADGARLLCGGRRQGALLEPLLLSDVDSQMQIVRDELFGPGVAVTPAGDVDEAIVVLVATVRFPIGY